MSDRITNQMIAAIVLERLGITSLDIKRVFEEREAAFLAEVEEKRAQFLAIKVAWRRTVIDRQGDNAVGVDLHIGGNTMVSLIASPYATPENGLTDVMSEDEFLEVMREAYREMGSEQTRALLIEHRELERWLMDAAKREKVLIKQVLDEMLDAKLGGKSAPSVVKVHRLVEGPPEISHLLYHNALTHLNGILGLNKEIMPHMLWHWDYSDAVKVLDWLVVVGALEPRQLVYHHCTSDVPVKVIPDGASLPVCFDCPECDEYVESPSELVTSPAYWVREQVVVKASKQGQGK